MQKDFLKVWKDIDCFLYQNEHKQIVQNIWHREESDGWKKLLTVAAGGKSGKFKMKNLIQKYKCGIIETPTNKNNKVNCAKCQKMISSN